MQVCPHLYLCAHLCEDTVEQQLRPSWGAAAFPGGGLSGVVVWRRWETACVCVAERSGHRVGMDRNVFDEYLTTLLSPGRFTDYAPNGLQIAGSREVSRVVTGVSANMALIEAAIIEGADTIVVHHGFFWNNEPRALTGVRGERVRKIMAADINLFAYHLPLDAHPTVGNNAQLLEAVGCSYHDEFASVGRIAPVEGVALRTYIKRLTAAIGEPTHIFGGSVERVHKAAVVTGGGGHYFEDAIEAGADIFITGEATEMAQALAAESGVAFCAYGHHNTERFGPRALGEKIANDLGLGVEFIDIPNPV